jgi:hypothetical protein
MKSRPILFSTPMVQAILEGRKTQTRRIVKPQPPLENIDEDPCFDYDRGVEKGSMENPVLYAEWAQWQDEFVNTTTNPIESHCVYSPYGKHGDVLWVKENFYAWGKWVKNGISKTGKQKYKFIDLTLYERRKYLYSDCKPSEILRDKEGKEKQLIGWYSRNSLFMPKEAARIWLKNTDLRVERLNKISNEDAIAEGIDFEVFNQEDNTFVYENYLRGKNFYSFSEYQWNFGKEIHSAPVASYCSLWESIQGDGSWNNNPWVWVIEFERIEKPSEV